MDQWEEVHLEEWAQKMRQLILKIKKKQFKIWQMKQKNIQGLFTKIKKRIIIYKKWNKPLYKHLLDRIFKSL